MWHLHNLKDSRDIELLGFIISCYTYGQVNLINAFIERLLKNTGTNIYEFTVNFSKSKDKKRLQDLYYRFNTGEHLISLFKILKKTIINNGSLNKMFLKYYDKNDENVLPALTGFVDELKSPLKERSQFKHFIPDPGSNSSCKRLNLYLRWMIRKDEIDLGIWKGIETSKLIMPLDVHVHRVAKHLNLVERKSPDLKFAIELTNRLKLFDPKDPVKYDFALCHIGVDKTGIK